MDPLVTSIEDVLSPSQYIMVENARAEGEAAHLLSDIDERYRWI